MDIDALVVQYLPQLQLSGDLYPSDYGEDHDYASLTVRFPKDFIERYRANSEGDHRAIWQALRPWVYVIPEPRLGESLEDLLAWVGDEPTVILTYHLQGTADLRVEETYPGRA